jgi:hypothetical protein
MTTTTRMAMNNTMGMKRTNTMNRLQLQALHCPSIVPTVIRPSKGMSNLLAAAC